MINPLYEDRFEQQPPDAEPAANETELPVQMVFEGEQRHHSFLYCTIIMALVVGLCLDFPVLLVCFVPALWFAKKVYKFTSHH